MSPGIGTSPHCFHTHLSPAALCADSHHTQVLETGMCLVSEDQSGRHLVLQQRWRGSSGAGGVDLLLHKLPARGIQWVGATADTAHCSSDATSANLGPDSCSGPEPTRGVKGHLKICSSIGDASPRFRWSPSHTVSRPPAAANFSESLLSKPPCPRNVTMALPKGTWPSSGKVETKPGLLVHTSHGPNPPCHAALTSSSRSAMT